MSIEGVLAKIAARGKSESNEPQISRHDSVVGNRRSSILGLLDNSGKIWLTEIRASPYYRLAEKALEEICKNGTESFGAISYIRKAHPEQAKQLEIDLWQQIERLWDEGAPIETFQLALDQWVKAHAEARNLFSEAVRNGDDLALSLKNRASHQD